MSRDWRIYLDDMRTCCRKIGDFTAGYSRADFEADVRTYDAVLRNLEILGEAAKHVPADMYAKIQGISSDEWRKIAGLRDVVAHAYFGIDNDILWDILSNKLPALRKALDAFAGESESGA